MASAAPSARPSTPEFMSSPAAGDLVAALLESGVAQFEQASQERGTPALDAATVRAGRRAVRQLRAVHAGEES